MSQSKPNCIVAGAMKCASTTIYEMMRAHPECHVPSVKEPRYFCSEAYRAMRHDRKLIRTDAIADSDAYYGLYADARQARIRADVSPQYLLFADEAATRIHEELGNETTIVILLRDPILRAYSAYNHMVRDGIVVGESFRQSLDREEARIAAGDPPVFHLKAAGLYAQQVDAFRRRFEKVHIYRYEDLQRAPEAFANNLTHDLGISPIKIDQHANRFRSPRFPLLNRILRRSAFGITAKRVAQHLGMEKASKRARDRLLNAISTTERTEISAEDWQYLAGYFADDVAHLSRETGLDLNDWLTPRSND